MDNENSGAAESGEISDADLGLDHQPTEPESAGGEQLPGAPQSGTADSQVAAPSPSSAQEAAPPWFQQYQTQTEAKLSAYERMLQTVLPALPKPRGAGPDLEQLRAKLDAPDATMADLLQYMEARDTHLKAELGTHTSRVASQANSEQAARGILSPTAVGEGNDYDSVIQRFVEPDLRAAPELNDIFSRQQDPAKARYAYGIMVAMLQRHGGDFASWAKSLLNPVGSQATTTRANVDAIQKAAQDGARKILGNNGKIQSPSGMPSAAEIDAMSDDDFAKRFNLH